MEEAKPYTTSTEQLAYQPPHLRARGVPDVPEDIDFTIEHLNDPNLDIKGLRPSVKAWELENKKLPPYPSSDADSDSHFDRYSTSRAESRNSSAVEDFDDESPYPEVRAAVSSVDDPSMPVNTFRMWTIGLFFTFFLPGLNQVLGMRYPSLYITGLVIQLLSLPIGKGMERILPTTRFNTFGFVWSLNPGPFNIKEHVCITVMANIAYPGGYATDILVAQRLFYSQQLSFAYQILLVLGIQVFGFSLAGILRRMFYYFLPGYLFTALSTFNWVCWIAPTNVTVNALFGSSGLGMSLLTFDWSMISYVSSPLVTPWWSEANVIVSFVFWFWIIAPIIYFTNTFNSAFMPISSYYSFDNTGASYDVSQVVTDGQFDIEKYRAYSPVFVPATLSLAYGLSFAIFPAVIVHTLLWFRRDLVRRFRTSLRDERDVHSRLMQAYREVPSWWYGLVGIISFLLVVIAIEIFPTQLPVWAAFLAFGLSAIAAPPIAFSVMYELIGGFMLPGKPVANVIFKAMGIMGSTQAATFAGDLKLGHYMKIPPRTMFTIQIVAVFVTCFVAVGTQAWMFANVEDMCLPTQKDGFICPTTNIFATASLIWGGIGPARMFGRGSTYNPLLWFFLIGAILPVPFYILARRYPHSNWRFANVPVFLAGVLAIPPASGINYASWALVGFIFNWYIRRFHFRWWMRYNYILSAALDAGTAFAIILIFLCLQLPKGGIILNWWGNTVWQNTADAMGLPLKTLNPGEIFGPSTWS
ncbi:glutathione transporter [Armillaria luteobubalina]|uniref:Glutathione transporter n=1 Tax=Armillaria luteobubalina TaxID=153913 RepID=A0AA39QPZ3_9AGAR|nr:glutathione transporter [Armillaria luteobubalina]